MLALSNLDVAASTDGQLTAAGKFNMLILSIAEQCHAYVNSSCRPLRWLLQLPTSKDFYVVRWMRAHLSVLVSSPII